MTKSHQRSYPLAAFQLEVMGLLPCLLTSTTPKAASPASVTNPSYGTSSPSLFTSTTMPPTG